MKQKLETLVISDVSGLLELSSEERKKLKKIVSGRISSEEIPKKLKYGFDGFHADYDRFVATQTLLTIDPEGAYEPILDYINELGSDPRKRHWTSSKDTLNFLYELASKDEDYRKRFSDEAIPALKEIGMDSDPKFKRVPTLAISVIGYLGGKEAEQALVYIQKHSQEGMSRWMAYRKLVENFNHPENEEWIDDGKGGAKKLHRDGYGPANFSIYEKYA